MEDVESRAFRAYFRRFGKDALMPSQNVDIISDKGKDYIVLSNSYRNLAVYRVFEDGSLKWVNLKWAESHVLQD
jgi:hypothetical protein